MKNKVVRWILIAITMVVAFLLFTNRQNTGLAYRKEIKSLMVQTEQISTDYVTALGKGVDIDLEGLTLYSGYYHELIAQYQAITGLPEEAMEDYEMVLEKMILQDDLQSQIIKVAQENGSVAGEWLLSLKEARESRVFYETRLSRY